MKIHQGLTDGDIINGRSKSNQSLGSTVEVGQWVAKGSDRREVMVQIVGRHSQRITDRFR